MSDTKIEGAGLLTLAAVSAGVLGLLAARYTVADAPAARRKPRLSPIRLPATQNADRLAGQAARQLNASSALLALSVLADSSIEHYRGMFHNKAMVLPILSSAMTLATSLHGTRDRTPQAHRFRQATAIASTGIGVIGGGFHLYNVIKRAGGLSWVNLFYGAPLGAPYALILAGTMGTAAEHVRDRRTPRISLFGLPAGHTLAAITAGGLAGTVAEAALLHFRGAFQDPFMYLPVTIPPVAAALIAKAGAERKPRWARFTRIWFWITAALGFAGAGFHTYGVSRNMGGWRNWSQNVLNGPPIPAPPSFTGLALAGLAALDLLEEAR